MSTYWHIFNVGMQNTLSYRVNFIVRALFNLVPLLAIISMWRAIYAGKTGDVAGYSLAAMISYYLLVTIVEATTAVTEDDWQIAAEIKDGQISQFLTRPIEYLHYRLCLFLAGRAVYTVAAFVPVTLFVFWHREYLLPPPDAVGFACFVLSLVMGALVQFLLSYIVAMLAFWVLEISTFVFILLACERLASGQMFPLDLLPSWLAHGLMWTPFPYGMYFPVSVYLGKVSGGALAQGLVTQLFWVTACYALARFIWQRGLKTYTVVGG
jgi:ABC-2 type transport system permease protein